MSTTRERREARAERLRGWAEGRDAKAEHAYSRARQTADMIPMGQPVMSRTDANRRAKMRSSFARSHEHATKAEQMRRKADNIEAAAAHAIYSDDHDAIQRLTAKIERLEADRDRIKKYNASARKTGPDELGDLTLLDDKQKADLLSVLKHAAWQCKNGAFPSYVLGNLGGTINTAKKRLAAMENDR